MKAISCLFGFALLLVVSGCGESSKPQPPEVTSQTVTLPDGQKATKATFTTTDGRTATVLVGQTATMTAGGTNGAPAIATIRAVTIETNGGKVKK